MDARKSKGWRPAVLGTGGIQEDRVPGARDVEACSKAEAARRMHGLRAFRVGT